MPVPLAPYPTPPAAPAPVYTPPPANGIKLFSKSFSKAKPSKNLFLFLLYQKRGYFFISFLQKPI